MLCWESDNIQSHESWPGSAAPAGPSQSDSAEDPEGLNPQEAAFVDAIAEGQSLKDGAAVAGIGYRTAKRWHKKDHIVAAIRVRVSGNLAQARAVLASGASRAARGLVSMADGSEPAESPRVSAARAVVEGASRLVEMEELAARLTELEARLSPKGK